MKVRPPAIVIDTREQKPYAFTGFATQAGTLESGDYSLAGYESRVACERKEQSDAYGCVGASRKRFEACLLRLSRMQSPCIVIEANLGDFCTPPARTRISAAQAVGAYISWSQEYRIPVFFCPNRAYAERVVIKWLTSFWRHEQRLKTITTAPPSTTSPT